MTGIGGNPVFRNPPLSCPPLWRKIGAPTLIESRLNAMNASVGLVRIHRPPLSGNRGILISSSLLPGSLCLCCRGKIHGKAFDSPGDLFVPSEMRRGGGYLTLNRGGLVCTLAGMQSADYRCEFILHSNNLHWERNVSRAAFIPRSWAASERFFFFQ